MEAWALRGMQRWPNVPALFGWLGLDRRGRWLVQAEVITRPQIIETINRNYQADGHGRWFFQNGPQRGYVALACAPFILHVTDDRLATHTGLPVEQPSQVCLDEEGSILIVTEHGTGALIDTDLDWALSHLQVGSRVVDERLLGEALSLPSGQQTGITMRIGGRALPLERLDREIAPGQLGFVRDPQPRNDEAANPRPLLI